MTTSFDLREVAAADISFALAEAHRSLPVDATVTCALRGDQDLVRELLDGAGFVEITTAAAPGDACTATARRARTLPDTVGAPMDLLVCGLNPSVRAADAGVGFVTPGNRFWPAALAAGIVTVDRDPFDAYRSHRVGMTDLVKRATARADELDRQEYRDGAARLARVVHRFRPGAICFVGLAGYRAAVDRHATSGIQERSFAGAPTYVMPNTSGLNARVPLAELTEHLCAAAALADAP